MTATEYGESGELTCADVADLSKVWPHSPFVPRKPVTFVRPCLQDLPVRHAASHLPYSPPMRWRAARQALDKRAESDRIATEESKKVLTGRVAGMNRVDLQQLAELRILEAHALLTLPAPMPDGAYYLAGYAVECGLKACIAKAYGAECWPEKDFVVKCHTHEIFALIRHAGLETAQNAAIAANPGLLTNLNIVKDWSERSRYERHSQTEAQNLYDAITDAADGVLTWIKVHW